MRGTVAKRIKKSVYGDMSPAREGRRYTSQYGQIINVPGTPRDLYQKAKKKRRIS